MLVWVMAFVEDAGPRVPNDMLKKTGSPWWGLMATALVGYSLTTACSDDNDPAPPVTTGAAGNAQLSAASTVGGATSTGPSSEAVTTGASSTSVGGMVGEGGVSGEGFGGSANAMGGTSSTNGGAGGASTSGPATVPIPEAGQYDNGFMPTTATPTDAVAAYDAFKAEYLEDCSGEKYRVRWDEPTQTVSEGIAYGMLLSVSFGEQAVFDGLWQYYTDNLDPNGLMHWQRGGCEGSQPTENSNNAASDADLDAAMALIMAECRFNDAGYGAQADHLIAAIREHETSESGGLALLHPGDVFGGSDCQNASYFAPAYYRVFAERAATTEESDFWLKLAQDSYTLIGVMDHEVTGFVPNWADVEGNTSESGPSGCNWYNDADIFGSDAIRTPWRVAVDYLWWGTPEADAWLDKVTAFVLSEGIENVGRKFELDGTPFGEIDHSIISLGAFANAAMAYDQATADAFAQEAVANVDEGYFPTSLRGLYLLVSAGLFTPCGGG